MHRTVGFNSTVLYCTAVSWGDDSPLGPNIFDSAGYITDWPVIPLDDPDP